MSKILSANLKKVSNMNSKQRTAHYQTTPYPVKRICKIKPCDSAEAKLTFTELLVVKESLRNPTLWSSTDSRPSPSRSFELGDKCNNLRKPLAVIVKFCFIRLVEMIKYSKLFPDSNLPLGKGDLIKFLTHRIPTVWCEKWNISTTMVIYIEGSNNNTQVFSILDFYVL